MISTLTEGLILLPRAGASAPPAVAGRAVILVEQFDDGAWGCDVIIKKFPLYPLGWIELDPNQIERDFIPDVEE